MIGKVSRRGQPLIALVLLLGGWVSARAMMWDPAGVPQVTLPRPAAAPAMAVGDARPARLAALAQRGSASGPVGVRRRDEIMPPPAISPLAPAALSANLATPAALAPQTPSAEPLDVLPLPQVVPAAPLASSRLPFLHSRYSRQFNPLVPARPSGSITPGLAAGHQMLWLAALAQLPMPASLLGLIEPPQAALPFYPRSTTTRTGKAGRWSVDAWLLLRRGSEQAPAGGLLTPSYGASQLGAVLRYRLAPGNDHRPAVYFRTTAALDGSNEREVALGLSARPLARVPVALLGEARMTATPSGHFVRPAVLAVTEFPPVPLPLGLRGELYAQGGYVGGKYATGFADGQLRVDHRLVKLGKADLRLGGGSWGGVQKGASRLDAGPTVTLGQPLGGPASVRLAADWRFRLAGDAAPGSGPAVTLSAGF